MMKHKILFVIWLLIYFSSVSYSQSGWFWQNPIPQGNYLNSITKIGNLNYACGDLGIIIKTSNSGLNWSIVRSASYENLYSIFFISNEIGWAAGGTIGPALGLILKTTNGGANWISQFASNTACFQSVCFIDSNTGWAVGGTYVYGALYKTTDGGTNWIQKPIISTDGLWSVHFYNYETGWVSGGHRTILKTTDEGESWFNQFGGGNLPLRSIQIISAETCWVSGDEGLYKTTNGGINWNVEMASYTRIVKFTSAQTGWIVGGSNPIKVFKTTNAGLNWINQSINSTNSIYGASFDSSGTGILAGQYGAMFKTINGGNNWLFSRGGINEAELYDISFLNNNTGWVIGGIDLIPGGNARLYKSVDGGYNWNSICEFPYIMKAVTFFNASTGWAGGGIWNSGKILKTTNGGNNWILMLDVLATGIDEIYFISPDTGWAVGELGRVVATKNGGVNWTYSSAGSPNSLSAVQFVNYNTGWVAGNGAGIYKSTNAGMNWFTQPLGALNIVDLFFVSDQIGWAAGNYIYKTTNAGINWETQNSGYYNFISLFFSSAETGWVSCAGGKILKTTDGGNTWLELNTGAGHSLRKIKFVNSNTGWVVGNESIILKTTTGGNLVGINEPASRISRSFSLSQNYPNPFNPVTRIKFSIPPSKVARGMITQLVIYDALGREIAVLVNEQLSPGIYEDDWDASNYPSGVYFYRLTAGDYAETKKMILLK